ncbi:MAG: tyrosine-type recombinase/integrase [Ktedonobacteraceae bacterium]
MPRRKGNEGIPANKQMSFESALSAFLTSHEAAGNSKETYKNYKLVVGLFINYMQEKYSYTAVSHISEKDILEWLAYLRNTTNRYGRLYSSRSVQTYSRDVSVFFHWLVQHKYLQVNPMAALKPVKVDKPLIRVFTEEELRLLDTACERAAKGKSLTPDERKALASRDRAFLWLLLSTGIRLSEACGLLFRDIDWNEGMIYVRGKGAKERKVPIGSVARQHLNTYIQYWRGETSSGDDHVFLNAFGNPLTKDAGHRIFVRLKEVADIQDKRVSAHTCRHWFAVNCIKNGMPTIVLQGLLGHESLEMVNTYVRLAEQDNRLLYTTYSPVDKLAMHHSTKDKRERVRDWRNARKNK